MASKKKESPPVAVPQAPSEDYETQGHLRTLMDAEMIKNDHEKMKKVHKLAGRHRKAISSIADLKHLHNEKYGPGADEEKKD